MRSIRRDFHRYGSARELSELGMKLANRRPVSHYGPSSESSDSDSDNNSTSVPTRTQVPEDVNLQHDEQSQARTTEKKEAVTASDLDSEKEEGVLTTKRNIALRRTQTEWEIQMGGVKVLKYRTDGSSNGKSKRDPIIEFLAYKPDAQNFKEYLGPQAENEMSLILIRDNELAMECLMSDIFDGNDSKWVQRYGGDLKLQILDFSKRSGYSHITLPTKKTQVFRILRDRHQEVVQGAFCINHWVSPLEDDEDDRLRQMIVYWQYQDVCNQVTVGKEGKKEKEKRDREKNPIPSSPARKDDLSKAPETRPELNRAPTRPFPSSAKVFFAEDSAGAHETRGSLLRSNLIVVFERSQLEHGRIGPETSIILHKLLQSLPNEYPQPIEDPKKFDPDAETRPELFEGEPSGLKAIELVKMATENVCEKLTEDLMENVYSYRIHQAQLAEEVDQNSGDDMLLNKLWNFSRTFQNAGKVVRSLKFLVCDLKDEFQHQLDESLFGEPFLAKFQQNLRQMTADIEHDLQRPIAEITDMVYKSVSIRDARNSYKLNTSLWRLSWVTFVFLPLTFMAGVFGMNVDTFEHSPSIKWYFITAVPFLACVFVVWLFFKYAMKKNMFSRVRSFITVNVPFLRRRRYRKRIRGREWEV